MAAAAAAATIAFTASPAARRPPAAVGPAAPITKEDLVLVASVINTTNPYMASMIEGAKALSAKLGVPLEIVDSQGSSQTEISKIQAILAQGKKVALMVNTVASSDAPTIVNAVKAAGGYVVIWWNKPDDLKPPTSATTSSPSRSTPASRAASAPAKPWRRASAARATSSRWPVSRTAPPARPGSPAWRTH